MNVPGRLLIRGATPADFKALNEIAAEGDAFHARGVPQVFQKPFRPGRSREFWAGVLRSRNGAILVAEHEGHIVGFLQVAVRNSSRLPLLRRRRFGYVSDLGVARRWRRRGVGSLLMAATHRWLLRRRVREIELNVWSFNRGAVKFYERLGYRFLSHRMGRALRARR